LAASIRGLGKRIRKENIQEGRNPDGKVQERKKSWEDLSASFHAFISL
jgi:hypothetical protein